MVIGGLEKGAQAVVSGVTKTVYTFLTYLSYTIFVI